jgi:pyridoxine/pyridoxamine 5'-phosphate oxidase
MTKTELLQYIKKYGCGIIATQSPSGNPQAAYVVFAVSDQLELVFDTIRSSRKWQNLQHSNNVAVVIGGWDGSETTLQYEGIADEPQDAELERIREVYFAAFPEGRDRLKWEGITHFRIKPTWIRYSDFNAGGSIEEFTAKDFS